MEQAARNMVYKFTWCVVSNHVRLFRLVASADRLHYTMHDDRTIKIVEIKTPQ